MSKVIRVPEDLYQRVADLAAEEGVPAGRALALLLNGRSDWPSANGNRYMSKAGRRAELAETAGSAGAVPSETPDVGQPAYASTGNVAPETVTALNSLSRYEIPSDDADAVLVALAGRGKHGERLAELLRRSAVEGDPNAGT